MKRLACILIALTSTAFAQTTFALSEGTEARFYIDEVLLGSPKTVVGTTSEVTGVFVLDLTEPQGAQLGTVTVNARTLTTDDDRRNRQLQNRILSSSSDEFQFITFEPLSVAGLPAELTFGESIELQLTGDLTIRGVTREETFDIALTVVSEKEIQGRGQTEILYADYELAIPRVPIVASTSDEVILEIVFTATAQD